MTFAHSAALALGLLLVAPAARAEESHPIPASTSADVDAVRDAELAPYRVELLELAFDAAGLFPLDPHVKNRSRNQARVVDAWLQLDQPARARAALPDIANWRRGLGWAALAQWCAEHDQRAAMESGLEQAQAVVDGLGPDEQGWRRDRIRARMAATWLVVGDDERAADAARALEVSERGLVDVARVRLDPDADFEAGLEALDTTLLARSFAEVEAALQTCVLLFDRHHADAERRTALAARLVDARGKVPRSVAIGFTCELAEVSLRHDDHDDARRWIDDAQALVDGGRWNPADQIPLASRLAALRHAAGDGERARADLDAARALFETERERIVNIDRADALIPLAEAYHRSGHVEDALEVYGLAAWECTVNPNSRPRVDDLVGLCVSLAVNGIEPDAALTARLHAVHEGLGAPW